MSVYESIKKLESDLDAIDKVLEPLDKLELKMQQQIDMANQTQAYTNKRPETIWCVNAQLDSGENAIEVSFDIDTDILIKQVQSNGENLKKKRKEIKSKLNQIQKLIDS